MCQSGCGQGQFYNLMEAKKGTAASTPWPADPQLCHPPLAVPTPALSLASRCVLLGLGVCERGRAVGAGAVYYLLLLDADTRAPILTAAVRLPGVQNQHLLKQSLGFYFHRKCSQQYLGLQHSQCACSTRFASEASSQELGKQIKN